MQPRHELIRAGLRRPEALPGAHQGARVRERLRLHPGGQQVAPELLALQLRAELRGALPGKG